MRASALAICLLVVLLAAGAAEASWTCNGITLYDAPTGDSGWQDYESAELRGHHTKLPGCP